MSVLEKLDCFLDFLYHWAESWVWLLNVFSWWVVLLRNGFDAGGVVARDLFNSNLQKVGV